VGPTMHEAGRPFVRRSLGLGSTDLRAGSARRYVEDVSLSPHLELSTRPVPFP
jgi:hypothetical protein